MKQPNFYNSKTASKRDSFFKTTRSNDGSTDYLVERIVRCVNETGARNLLDLGTGNGYLAWRVLQETKGKKLLVLGVDASQAMLDSSPYKDQAGLSLKLMNNLKLDIPSNSVDIVMAKAVTNISIKEVWRVLKPGGHFFYKEYSGGKGMVEVFNAAGIERAAGGLQLIKDLYNHGFSYVGVEYFNKPLKHTTEELTKLVETMRLSTPENQPRLLKAVKQLTKGKKEAVITSDPFVIVAQK